MSFVKRNAAAIAAGAVVIVGGSYVGAKALTAPQTVTLDSANAAAAASPAPQQRGLIRGEGVVARPDGTFPTVQINRGILSSVDGTTLVISEADGTTQRVDTTADTRVRRDGKRASLSDLQPGDHVSTLAVKDGDGFVTKFVRAFSPEMWQKHESMRMQRRAARRAGSSL
jgi:hypothetical protein